MKRKLTVIAVAVLLPLSLLAQQKHRSGRNDFDDAFLDTVLIEKPKVINDYSMLGVSYGVNFCRQYLNPTYYQSWTFKPTYVSLLFTHYQKMFNYLPYFGFQIGLSYSYEGYDFTDRHTGNPTHLVFGANKAAIRTIELPFMLQGHVDADWFRVLFNLGAYAGYRLSIERSGPDIMYEHPELVNAFAPTDHRFDYGALGGAGIGFVFEPFEFHINALVRFSFSTLYAPDYKGGDYYYFSNPLDLVVNAGIHVHLNNRYGKTRKQLKKEAYDIVYGTKDSSGQDR